MAALTPNADPAVKPPKAHSVKNTLTTLRRRRTYLSDPNTQFAITRHFMLVLISACGLTVGNYHVFQTMLEVDKHDDIGIVVGYGYSAVMLLISVALMILLCVFFSHRVAGPAHKISEALNRMAHGDLCVKVVLRDEDLLKGLADGVNATNRELRSALGEIRREIRRAQGLAQDNHELAAMLQRAERQLEEFRLTSAEEHDAREVASRGARRHSA